jgi:hypothetical protein
MASACEGGALTVRLDELAGPHVLDVRPDRRALDYRAQPGADHIVLEADVGVLVARVIDHQPPQHLEEVRDARVEAQLAAELAERGVVQTAHRSRADVFEDVVEVERILGHPLDAVAQVDVAQRVDLGQNARSSTP